MHLKELLNLFLLFNPFPDLCYFCVIPRIVSGQVSFLTGHLSKKEVLKCIYVLLMFRGY